VSHLDDAVSGTDDGLAGLFQRLASEVADVLVVATPSVTEYRRGDRPFAALEGGVAEVRLNPEVAEAAQRTSHTTSSTRGSGWVRFEPPSVDEFVMDRAGAWFLSAWRAAER
jgi:hypothetical protein